MRSLTVTTISVGVTSDGVIGWAGGRSVSTLRGSAVFGSQPLGAGGRDSSGSVISDHASDCASTGAAGGASGSVSGAA